MKSVSVLLCSVTSDFDHTECYQREIIKLKELKTPLKKTFKKTHLFPSKQKNKLVFATFVLTLLETEKPDGVNFEN